MTRYRDSFTVLFHRSVEHHARFAYHILQTTSNGTMHLLVALCILLNVFMDVIFIAHRSNNGACAEPHQSSIEDLPMASCLARAWRDESWLCICLSPREALYVQMLGDPPPPPILHMAT
jgi:hypothetical protein